MRSPTYLRVAVAAGAVALVTACVKIPGEVEAQFAPAQPYETNNFRRRSDAPSPLGFVTENDLAPIPAAADAGAGDAGDPDAAGDGGLQNAMRRLGELSATSASTATQGVGASDASADAAPATTTGDAAAPKTTDGGAP